MIRRIVVAALASLLCSALPTGQSQALTTDSAQVEVFADYAGSADGPIHGSSTRQVQRDALVDPAGARNYSRARARAIAGDSSTRAWVGGLGDVTGMLNGISADASSASRVLEFYEVLGTGRVDFNMFADIDGKLSGGNFSGPNGPSRAGAWINYHVNLLVAGSPSQRLFTASARYDILESGLQGTLTISGDWDASAFSFSSTGAPQSDSYIEQTMKVRYDQQVDRTFSVDGGSFFALEFVLETGAEAADGSKLAARSNFLETGYFTIDTDQDGVDFRPIDEGDLPPVPEPGTGVLLSIGLVGLTTLGGRAARI